MKKIPLLLSLLVSTCTYSQVCVSNTSSLKFNGNSDYVQINSSNNLALDSALTVEAWIKPSAWGNEYWDNSIFCKHSWSTGEQGYVLRCGANGQLSFNFAGLADGVPTSWKDIVSDDNALVLDTWQHVVGSFDGYRMRLFVNGVQIADSLFVGTLVPGTNFNACIGRLSDFGAFETRYFKGKIDEVRVWNRALSQEEIQQKMSVHLDPSQEIGLVGYWRLNDSTGSAVTDLSGNLNNGTKYGASWQLDDVPFNNAATIPTVTQSGDLLISSSSSSYQWYLDGDVINGATDQTYLATQNGSYFVQITDSIGCSAVSDTVGIIPTGVLAVDENNFTVLGNPTSDILVIEMKSIPKHGSLYLRNSIGQMVYENELTGNESRLTIDVSNLPEGIYWVVMIANGAIMKQQVALQR